MGDLKKLKNLKTMIIHDRLGGCDISSLSEGLAALYIDMNMDINININNFSNFLSLKCLRNFSLRGNFPVEINVDFLNDDIESLCIYYSENIPDFSKFKNLKVLCFKEMHQPFETTINPDFFSLNLRELTLEGYRISEFPNLSASKLESVSYTSDSRSLETEAATLPSRLPSKTLKELTLGGLNFCPDFSKYRLERLTLNNFFSTGQIEVANLPLDYLQELTLTGFTCPDLSGSVLKRLAINRLSRYNGGDFLEINVEHLPLDTLDELELKGVRCPNLSESKLKSLTIDGFFMATLDFLVVDANHLPATLDKLILKNVHFPDLSQSKIKCLTIDATYLNDGASVDDSTPVDRNPYLIDCVKLPLKTLEEITLHNVKLLGAKSFERLKRINFQDVFEIFNSHDDDFYHMLEGLEKISFDVL